MSHQYLLSTWQTVLRCSCFNICLLEKERGRLTGASRVSGTSGLVTAPARPLLDTGWPSPVTGPAGSTPRDSQGLHLIRQSCCRRERCQEQGWGEVKES